MPRADGCAPDRLPPDRPAPCARPGTYTYACIFLSGMFTAFPHGCCSRFLSSVYRRKNKQPERTQEAMWIGESHEMYICQRCFYRPVQCPRLFWTADLYSSEKRRALKDVQSLHPGRAVTSKCSRGLPPSPHDHIPLRLHVMPGAEPAVCLQPTHPVNRRDLFKSGFSRRLPATIPRGRSADVALALIAVPWDDRFS